MFRCSARQCNHNQHSSPNEMWLWSRKLHLLGCKDWPIFFLVWVKKKGIEPTAYSSNKNMKSIKNNSGRLHSPWCSSIRLEGWYFLLIHQKTMIWSKKVWSSYTILYCCPAQSAVLLSWKTFQATINHLWN